MHIDVCGRLRHNLGRCITNDQDSSVSKVMTSVEVVLSCNIISEFAETRLDSCSVEEAIDGDGVTENLGRSKNRSPELKLLEVSMEVSARDQINLKV